MGKFLNNAIMKKLVAPMLSTFKVVLLTDTLSQELTDMLFDDKDFELQYQSFIKECLEIYFDSSKTSNNAICEIQNKTRDFKTLLDDYQTRYMNERI